MVEITKVYRQTMPASKFIGFKYKNEDRVDGMFGYHWGQFYEKGYNKTLETLLPTNPNDFFENSNAPIGLIYENGEAFEYWIGFFMPENTVVPKGFDSIDFLKSELGVCWVYGKEEEIFAQEGSCGEKLEKEGFEIIDDDRKYYCFERYVHPRNTTPDEKGNIILDICFFVK